MIFLRRNFILLGLGLWALAHCGGPARKALFPGPLVQIEYPQNEFAPPPITDITEENVTIKVGIGPGQRYIPVSYSAPAPRKSSPSVAAQDGPATSTIEYVRNEALWDWEEQKELISAPGELNAGMRLQEGAFLNPSRKEALFATLSAQIMCGCKREMMLSAVFSLASRPKNSHLRLTRVNYETRRIVSRITVNEHVWGVDLSPDGRYLLCRGFTMRYWSYLLGRTQIEQLALLDIETGDFKWLGILAEDGLFENGGTILCKNHLCLFRYDIHSMKYAGGVFLPGADSETTHTTFPGTFQRDARANQVHISSWQDAKEPGRIDSVWVRYFRVALDGTGKVEALKKHHSDMQHWSLCSMNLGTCNSSAEYFFVDSVKFDRAFHLVEYATGKEIGLYGRSKALEGARFITPTIIAYRQYGKNRFIPLQRLLDYAAAEPKS